MDHIVMNRSQSLLLHELKEGIRLYLKTKSKEFRLYWRANVLFVKEMVKSEQVVGG
jgi:hypothetical protein